jgi:PAS domain S-box-containing protein
MTKLLGYAFSDFIHHPVFRFLEESSRKQVRQRWEKRKKGVDEQYEVRFVHKDGHCIDTLLTAHPIFSEDKVFQGALALVTNITRIKKTEEKLFFLSHASQALAESLDYRKTLQHITELLVPKLADWCVIDVLNEEGEVVTLGISHKDPKQVKWAKKLRKEHPIDPDSDQGVARVLRTGKPEIYPIITDEMLAASVTDKDHLQLLQKIGFRSIMIVPLVGHKQVLGVISLVTTKESNQQYDLSDLQFAEELAMRASLAIENSRLYEEAQREIEERRKTEEQLLKAQQQFQRLIESSIIGITIADFNGYVVSCNDAFLEMIGYSREELEKGQISWRSITPPEYREIDNKAMEELLQYGECTPYEKEYICKDGRRIPILVGKAMYEDTSESKKYTAFTLDISERKQIEKRKDEFIGIASHELKSPLTSLKGLTQILQKKYQNSTDTTLVSYLNKMDYQIKQLQNLVTSLLDVSVIQSGKIEYQFEKIAIDQLVIEAIENVQLNSDTHHIELIGQSGKNVLCDKHRIYQVMVNLLTNAIKYSPQAERVEVKIENTEKKVMVSVTDFGIGIPSEHQHRIFDRFYRVGNKGKYVFGLGLGLYISAEIIKRHHGEISLRSKREKGTTFYFSLPIAE